LLLRIVILVYIEDNILLTEKSSGKTPACQKKTENKKNKKKKFIRE
jgi:hypothetical protein